MKCIDCKWFAGTANDTYGVCKRYPQVINKNQNDWCGEFKNKNENVAIEITPELIEEMRKRWAYPQDLGTVMPIKCVQTEPAKRGRKQKE